MKTLLIILFSITLQAQIIVGVFADGKMLVSDDDYGNEAPTLDLVTKVAFYNGGNRADNWSKQIFVVAQFEYADLDFARYLRYSAGAGYEFNVWKLGLQPSVNYGIIERFDNDYAGFEFAFDIDYHLSKRVSLTALFNLTDRRDILAYWGDRVWRENFYLGLKYKLQ